MAGDSVSRRVFVGGLPPDVREAELTERFRRFGEVSDLDMKTKVASDGVTVKSFAHLSITGSEQNVKKCIQLYNKSKWKKHELQVQIAKPNFLERLKREKKDPTREIERCEKGEGGRKHDVICDMVGENAEPGTTIEGKKDWVVGKHGTVLPVLNIRDKGKIIKVDPTQSKESVKMLDNAEEKNSNVDELTWNIPENTTRNNIYQHQNDHRTSSSDDEDSNSGGVRKPRKTAVNRTFSDTVPAAGPKPAVTVSSWLLSESSSDEDGSLTSKRVVTKKETKSQRDKKVKKKTGEENSVKKAKSKVVKSIKSVDQLQTVSSGELKVNGVELSETNGKKPVKNRAKDLSSDEHRLLCEEYDASMELTSSVLSKDQLSSDASDDDILDLIDAGKVDQVWAKVQNTSDKSPLTKPSKKMKPREDDEFVLGEKSPKKCLEKQIVKSPKKDANEPSPSSKGTPDSHSSLSPSKKKKKLVDINNSTADVTKHIEDSSTDSSHQSINKAADHSKPKTEHIDKHELSNKQRLASLREKDAALRAQKSAIQNALSAVDSSSSKRKVFDSDDEADDITQTPGDRSEELEVTSTDDTPAVHKRMGSSDVFGEESDDDDEDIEKMFRIRPQFQGKKGEELLKRQIHYSSDSRFKLDARFRESESEDDDEEAMEVTEDESPDKSEKTKVLSVLESVVGVKGGAKKKDNKKAHFRDVGALHYDPSRDDHRQYEKTVEEKVKPEKQQSPEKPTKQSKKKKQKKDESTNEQSAEAEPMPEVSKEKFYEVSTSLGQTLGKQTDQQPFSLLSMFGADHIDEKQREAQAQSEVLSANTASPWKPSDAFNTREAETEEAAAESGYVESTDVTSNFPFRIQPPKTFFIAPDDPRLREGIQFFRCMKDPDQLRRDWLKRKPELEEAWRLRRKTVRQAMKTGRQEKTFTSQRKPPKWRKRKS